MNQGAFSGVKTVLVVLSSRAMTIDQAGLRNLISHAYPGSAVFFVSTSGDPVGVKCTRQIDLLIDFTEPGARQPFFFAFTMRRRARYAIGRRVGWVRKNRYTEVYDHTSDSTRPRDYLESERHAQRKVLELAGVPVIRHGGVTPDRSKDIASNAQHS